MRGCRARATRSRQRGAHGEHGTSRLALGSRGRRCPRPTQTVDLGLREALDLSSRQRRRVPTERGLTFCRPSHLSRCCRTTSTHPSRSSNRSSRSSCSTHCCSISNRSNRSNHRPISNRSSRCSTSPPDDHGRSMHCYWSCCCPTSNRQASYSNRCYPTSSRPMRHCFPTNLHLVDRGRSRRCFPSCCCPTASSRPMRHCFPTNLHLVDRGRSRRCFPTASNRPMRHCFPTNLHLVDHGRSRRCCPTASSRPMRHCFPTNLHLVDHGRSRRCSRSCCCPTASNRPRSHCWLKASARVWERRSWRSRGGREGPAARLPTYPALRASKYGGPVEVADLKHCESVGRREARWAFRRNRECRCGTCDYLACWGPNGAIPAASGSDSSPGRRRDAVRDVDSRAGDPLDWARGADLSAARRRGAARGADSSSAQGSDARRGAG